MAPRREAQGMGREDRVAPSRQRNAISAFMVSSGRSSISQCPVSFRSTWVTEVATSFICGPRIAALAFSPAIERTGIVSFVLAICAKSFAVSGQAAKYAQPARIRPGREYAATYALRSAVLSERPLSAARSFQKYAK